MTQHDTDKPASFSTDSKRPKSAPVGIAGPLVGGLLAQVYDDLPLIFVTVLYHR
eukprot:COSAG05_NODE_22104_length_267_cov_0.613095_1_plen_53_part_10